jgi:hypothetical protein
MGIECTNNIKQFFTTAAFLSGLNLPIICTNGEVLKIMRVIPVNVETAARLTFSPGDTIYDVYCEHLKYNACFLTIRIVAMVPKNDVMLFNGFNYVPKFYIVSSEDTHMSLFSYMDSRPWFPYLIYEK